MPAQQEPQQPPPAAVGAAAAAGAQAVGTLAAMLAVVPVPLPAVLALLTTKLKGPPIDRDAAQAAVKLAMSQPPPTVAPVGPATKQAMATNRKRRAQYVIHAARRLTKAARGTDTQGKPRTRGERLRKALKAERRYFRQQRAAHWNRLKSAEAVDGMANAHDGLVGWHSQQDNRVTPECARAHGNNFNPSDPPSIGMPGASTHPNCRCFPCPPWPNGRLLT